VHQYTKTASPSSFSAPGFIRTTLRLPLHAALLYLIIFASACQQNPEGKLSPAGTTMQQKKKRVKKRDSQGKTTLLEFIGAAAINPPDSEPLPFGFRLGEPDTVTQRKIDSLIRRKELSHLENYDFVENGGQGFPYQMYVDDIAPYNFYVSTSSKKGKLHNLFFVSPVFGLDFKRDLIVRMNKENGDNIFYMQDTLNGGPEIFYWADGWKGVEVTFYSYSGVSIAYGDLRLLYKELQAMRMEQQAASREGQ
jgi:hypothetical protein